jgi:chromosome segregation ATPase
MKPIHDRVNYLETVLPRLEALVEKSAEQIAELAKLSAETNHLAKAAFDRAAQVETIRIDSAGAAQQLIQARSDVSELKRDMSEVRKTLDTLGRKGVALATTITLVGAIGSYLMNSVSFYPKNPPPTSPQTSKVDTKPE